MSRFSQENFHSICDLLVKSDKVFQSIFEKHGYPPMWTRKAGFATLIHIILEQQVSLASARAAFLKLKAKLGVITPGRLLKLSDEEMKDCYFSRQKTLYARELAESIVSKKLQLAKLSTRPETEVRISLKQIKGIGDWTADIYLMFSLQHVDIFPTGDLALMQALKEMKRLPKDTTKEEILELSEAWRPYRSIATMFFWHYYLCKRQL